jgi:starch phosphorylase
MEAVATSTVFTTHTAVEAGHDHFAAEKIERYFSRYCKEMKIDCSELLALGRMPGNGEFNMTALAARGARYVNGVSRIHGDVSSIILRGLWPEIPEQENPIAYVTNGVHVPTFLAPEWTESFDRFVGSGWPSRIADPEALAGILEMPDHIFWTIRQHLKSLMLQLVGKRLRAQYARNQLGEAHVDRLLRLADPADPNVLTVGFARRFATYKRANLLFENLEWLREIACDPKRPVVFVFAGKAHPADEPGKEMIRRVLEIANQPQFEGHVLFAEGYDLRLARRLVSGVDVWLNNPVFPLEASGTSGMKAGFNGVINLSVLDGWWGEGYRGDNGWAIKPASERLDDERRDLEEGRALYEILQDKVVPLYYEHGPMGFSPEWVKLAKRSVMTLLPRFNSHRMLGEYLARFYAPAARRGRQVAEDNYAKARELAAWKAKVRAAWPNVTLKPGTDHGFPPGGKPWSVPGLGVVEFGDKVHVEVVANLNGLEPADVAVELLVASTIRELRRSDEAYELQCVGGRDARGECRFALDLAPELCGKLELRVRAYPRHAGLTHRFEMGLMKWV